MKKTSGFALRPIWNIGLRYLLRHPWQTGLMILGITLGVAVVVAIDLANASALRAFTLSTEAVTGRATHQIVTGPLGVDESTYVRVKQSGVIDYAAPVISEYISSPELGSSLIQLLGIDPFSDAPFRDYLRGESDNQSRQPINNLLSFLTRPGAVLISSNLAERFGLTECATSQAGCEIHLDIAGEEKPAVITGILLPSNDLSRRALDNLIITDIATAQEFTGRIGKIDRIDLIIPNNQTQIIEPQIKNLLPTGTRVITVEARQGTIEEMTSAFRINLTALSLLALVVGMFLIYNTITFSVVQRRPLFGTLRSLGFTRRDIFIMVILEALAAGLIGSVLGMGLGLILGQGAVRMVTQTINDLFFVVSVRGIQIPPISLIKGAILGIAATLLTAAPPSWEAATASPRMALSRSSLEIKARKAVRLAAIAGLFLLILGCGLLLIPSNDLVISFSATFAVIIGVALEAPLMTMVLMRAASSPLGKFWGSLGRMAPRDVINSLSRTSIAIAALMVAVSVTIGVSLMVASFRSTVVAWLGDTLQGDIYISAPSQTSTQTSAPLNDQVLRVLNSWHGVNSLYLLRSVNVDSHLGETHIAATSNPLIGDERTFISTSIPKREISAAMQQGAVIISEPFANRVGIHSPGGSVTLYTDRGEVEFPIVGIFYDYSSTQGTILMNLDKYQEYWDDTTITAAAIKLAPGADLDQTIDNLKSALGLYQHLLIRANQVLRNEVMNVFDRTFAITSALQLLATIVAFIGILSAFLSIELERQRELGILRAVGMTTRQLWELILLETGLMGAVAGILAMPTGLVLATILVYIINRRSFGWTLQMQILIDPFLLALLVAVGAALLAGIYPALRMSRMLTAEAIRYE